MKIIAVIPARAGSKGVPNKNIRLLNNRPLVYYAIQNAQHSQLITDIVVSTDSPEVATIAKQMGVPVHWRSEELCADSVTLDAVVHDAIRHGQWDYVVTLQPTSPTLLVETLDSAIHYAVAHQIDTLISAINRPHLAWEVQNGKKVPSYQQRLNRQYLPPSYQETGAFVISRASVVTPNTRIGNAVDIYELSEAEAVDVDTFYDLQIVETILTEKQVAIYVNGNNQMGTGHIYRALELADEFYVRPDIYYDTNQTDKILFGTTTHTLIGVNGKEDLFHHVRQKQYQYFINDILDTSAPYMASLQDALGPACKVINFEDDGPGAASAALVINSLYANSPLPHVYTGNRYYIAPKPFLFSKPIPIRPQVKNVLLSFGGADPQNYTDKLLAIVAQQRYASYSFLAILGRAKQNISELLEYNSHPNIQVLVDVPNMAEIMSSCDIALTSRGRTGYELAILGIPTIAMAQNKREEQHGFVCNENGYFYLGPNPTGRMIENALQLYLESPQQDRLALQKTMLQHDLTNGRRRIMGLIRSL